MRIAATMMLLEHTLPALDRMMVTYREKVAEYDDIRKIGRTHLMDATPLTLGQELSGHLSQLEHGAEAIRNAMRHLMELPIGGTAVGNGLNTPEGYDTLALQYINTFTGQTFTNSPNKYEAMASHDSLAEVSGALKRLAVSLMKIANDFRLLNSGPRCGIGEVVLPANEPGSSIMPGKVNPTQCEAVTMVAVQVMGNDASIGIAASQGNFELNVFMPVIACNFLQSAGLLADVMESFNKNCAAGIRPNKARIAENLEKSLMLVTALNPYIGYENAAKIAKFAHKEGMTLREAAIALGLLTGEQYDEYVQPAKMI